MSTSEDLKAKGNEAFVSKDYKKAVSFYSDAIAIDSSNPVLYSNRAQCYINLLDWKHAHQDIDTGLSLRPDNKVKVKLLFRKSTVLKSGLDDEELAKSVLRQLLTIDPNNTAALALLNQLMCPETKRRRTDVSESSGYVDVPISFVDLLPPAYAQKLSPVEVHQKPTSNARETPSSDVDKIAEQLFASRRPKQASPGPSNDHLLTPTASRKELPRIHHDFDSLPDSQKDNYAQSLVQSDFATLKAAYSSYLDPTFLQLFLLASAYILRKQSGIQQLKDIEERLILISSFGRFKLALLLCDKHVVSAFVDLLQKNDHDFYQENKNLFS